jgi:group I intron endonuclease
MKGIYKISNTINGKYYIGSSKNIHRRIKRHFYELKRGIHHSTHLQNAYNKYGKESFIYEIVLECENLLEEEQKLLDILDWSLSYNISKYAVGGDRYTNNPNKEELRLKLIECLKPTWREVGTMCGEANFNWRGGISKSKCKICKKVLQANRNLCGTCCLAQRRKSIIIDDIEYCSIIEAAKTLKVERKTITRRLKSPNFSSYIYKDNQKQSIPLDR